MTGARPAPLLFDDLPLMTAAPAGASSPAGAWRPAAWPFAPLSPGRYGLILADPPWSFDNFSAKGEAKNPKAHYACMPLPEIQALPVAQLADPRGCLLWMWATWPMLREALATLDAWGFRYVTGGAWHKKTKHGKDAFGTGYVLRSATEPFLIGVRERPAYGPDARRVRGLIVSEGEEAGGGADALAIEAVVREHSRKPDVQYAMLRSLVPDAPAAELFARQSWPGWEVWGNQTERFAVGAGGPDPPALAPPLPAPHPEMRGATRKVPEKEKS